MDKTPYTHKNYPINTVYLTCDKTCSQQINLLKSVIKLPLLNDEESDLIDAMMDGLQMSPEDTASADHLLSKNIMDIFKNIVPVIDNIMNANAKSRRNQRNEIMNMVISLTNLADMMPEKYHSELFIEISKVLVAMNSRAALKFCSTLFSLQFYFYKEQANSKLIANEEDEEESDTVTSNVQKSENLLNLYGTWLTVAGKSGCLHEAPHTINDINVFIQEWNLTGTTNEAKIWQLLFKQLAILSSKPKSSFATNSSIDRISAVTLTNKVMLKMLEAGSRVLEKEEQIKLAKECILHALRDKKTFLYDSLQRAKSMSLILDTPDYKLLSIFTNGTLPDYRNFVNSKSGKIFLKKIEDDAGIDPKPFLERKIRQLTFIELAGDCLKNKRHNNGEPNTTGEAYITMDQLKEKLDLKDDETIEEFIIDAIRTNMVKAKLSQSQRRVIIHHAVNREFTKVHWEELLVRLNNWKEQIQKVQKGFNHIINDIAPKVFENSVTN